MKNSIQLSHISGSSRPDLRSYVPLLLAVHIQPLASGSPREVPCRERTEDCLWMWKVSQSVQTGTRLSIGTEESQFSFITFKETPSLDYQSIIYPKLSFIIHFQDSLLYWHLHREHGMRLFFFCKSCFMGSVDGSVIFSHVTNSNSCVRYRNWHPNNIIGMCPLGLINYQPSNEEKYMENYAAREVSKLQIKIEYSG